MPLLGNLGRYRAPPAVPNGVVAIGDSNTHQSYFVTSSMAPGGTATGGNGHHPEKRWTEKVAAATGLHVANWAWNGARTSDFLGRGPHAYTELLSQWWITRPRYALIMLGLNEATEADFELCTRDLVRSMRGRGVVPIFVTNVAVDYVGGHYSWNRNPTIDAFDDVYRLLANELGIGLVDANAAVKSAIALGTWDHRIRADGVTLDSSLDASRPPPYNAGDPSAWFTDIHLSEAGSILYAEAIAAYVAGL